MLAPTVYTKGPTRGSLRARAETTQLVARCGRQARPKTTEWLPPRPLLPAAVAAVAAAAAAAAAVAAAAAAAAAAAVAVAVAVNDDYMATANLVSAVPSLSLSPYLLLCSPSLSPSLLSLCLSLSLSLSLFPLSISVPVLDRDACLPAAIHDPKTVASTVIHTHARVRCLATLAPRARAQ